MKHKTQKKRLSSSSGLTLIEVTLVISTLLSLISFSVLGVSAYKQGSDRALCIVHVTQVQKAIRAFGNLQQVDPGDTFTGLTDAVIGPGRFIEETPVCPSGGTYTFLEDEMPAIGVAYMKCSIADHQPATSYRW
ncbi:MAG: hypothetical protein AAF491_03585 [Verrucomicrobiota bacterium]